MTEGKNIFSRFFRMLVMLHKIPYAHFTEWNNKRKHKALAAGVYCLSIIPEYVLLAGTFLAARGQDGYVHLVNVPQKVVFYGLAGLAVLLSAIPLGFFDDKKICKETGVSGLLGGYRSNSGSCEHGVSHGLGEYSSCGKRAGRSTTKLQGLSFTAFQDRSPSGSTQ